MSDNAWDVQGKHCDEYIRDKSQPMALRRFLLYKRIPAYWQMKRWRWPVPVCYADYTTGGQGGGKRHHAKKTVRVKLTMASRFGDVGIGFDLDPEKGGYTLRVAVESLSNFSDKP